VSRHAALHATARGRTHHSTGPVGFVYAVRCESLAYEHDAAAASRRHVLAERAAVQRRMHRAPARGVSPRQSPDAAEIACCLKEKSWNRNRHRTFIGPKS